MSRSQLTSTVEQNTGGAVAPFVAGKNKIINGDFGVWQRGTSFSGGTYTSDRWYNNYDGTGSTRTISQQIFTPGTAPVAGYEGTYFYRFNQSVAGISGTYNNFCVQAIEDVRVFANQTVTLSFWAKSDATRTITPYAIQNFGSSGSSNVVTTGTAITTSTSWTRYTQTISIPSVSGKTIGTSSCLLIALGAANNIVQTIDIWGVQLEAGSVATPFTTATGTLSGELAACQRYYQKWIGADLYQNFALGMGTSSTVVQIFVPSLVAFRSNPSSIDVNTLSIQVGNGTAYQGGTFAIWQSSPNVTAIRYTHTSGVFTLGTSYYLQGYNNTGSYLGISAEL